MLSQNRGCRRLGTTTDLRTFLFGSDRAALARYRPILEDAQEGRCLYCERGLGGSVEVDHFIPWRRYPTDLGHNFVLVHGGCNARKGDRLAAEEHLARWWGRFCGGFRRRGRRYSRG